jgi:hypothetical protein
MKNPLEDNARNSCPGCGADVDECKRRPCLWRKTLQNPFFLFGGGK